MKELTPRLRELIAAVAARRSALIILDYDGTLVPIRSRPGLARLDARQRKVMSRIHGSGMQVAMLSGRSVANLKKRVAIPDIGYGGVFGLELSAPGWSYLHPAARTARPAIAGLISALLELYKDIPGVQVEDKEAGLTLHYRRVPKKLHPEFSRRLEKARSLVAAPVLEWTRGKAAWEVVPRTNWSKGKAALMLWRRAGRPFLLAIGDDPFDESMLRAAQRYGAGIRVGEGPSKAGYRLKDPDEVNGFLRALADAVEAMRNR